MRTGMEFELIPPEQRTFFRRDLGGRINFACRHYKASKPCVFNKIDASECPTCTHASEYGERILFIKLDAIGDVLRSASVLPALLERHDRPLIAWLTRRESVALVGIMKHVDEVIELSDVGMARVATGGWDHVYSLSNDMTSAAIASTAPARRSRVGFWLEDGIMTPGNAAARRWLEMAAFDRLKRDNTETYQQHMLAILGHSGPVRPPALNVDTEMAARAAARVDELFRGSGRPRVAINVGSGSRWPKKMLDERQIAAFTRSILACAEVDVMLVGGVAEAPKTAEILSLCGSSPHIGAALTTASVPEFVAALQQADVLLCGDTLALHIATAIALPTIAVFGPTSMAEIADFDGLVAKTAAAGLDCLCCYGDCSKERNCMSLLDIDHLVELTLKQMPS